MKANTFNNKKKTYISPMLEVFSLDNEISLTLMSDDNPASEPDWLTYAPKTASLPLST